GFSNNPGAGSSDWVKLTTSYQNLYFTSLSPQQLQADPPPGMTASSSATTPPITTSPVTSGATAPVVSVADNTLSVQPGGKVDLGVEVSTTDNNDVVSVNIQNLASYETITDNLDGHTFTGKNITLTAAEVESGLTLQSNYTGSGDLTVTLAGTATGEDPRP